MKFNEEQKELISLLQFKEEELKGKKLTDAQKLVYAHLCFSNDGYPLMKEQTAGWFTQSYEQIRKGTKIGSDETISKALNALDKFGLIRYKKGTSTNRIANQYFIPTLEEKCSVDEKSVVLDFAKCTDEERFNFLKEKKLRKSVVKNCSTTEKKCSIDIEIEKEENKEKENRDIMENLEVKQTEVKETELEKALKRIEVLEEKVNYYEINQKTLFQTVGELVERFNNILQNPFFNNIPATAGNNLPSNRSERKPEGNESSNESGKNKPSTERNNAPQGLTPSTGRFSKQQAEELEQSFNFFIKNLRNYSPEEQKKLMEHFNSKAKETYTGNFIEKKLQWMEASFQGMYKTINGKTPSKTSKEEKATKPTTQPTAQPANNGLSENDIFNEISNTFSRDHYSPATAKQARERIQNLIFNSNLTTNQKKNLLEYLFRANNDRYNEYKKEIEAQNSQLNPQADNDTTNVTKSENESKNTLSDEADTQKNKQSETTIKDENTGLSNDSIFNKMKYELNNIETAEDAKDWVFNNKNTIQKLEPQQRDELKKLYIEILNAA